jgi:hypothetical protein
MSPVSLSFDIDSTDYNCALGVSVWYQNTCLFDLTHVTEPVTFSHEFDDKIEQTHEIKITISGKKPEHTKIDSQGNIVSDVLLKLNNFALDGICIDPLMYDIFDYHHDRNGSREPIVDQFYGDAGCNGDLIFSFSTPVYLWLLERL